MRRVQLKYATLSVILVVAASVIVFAGVRAWVTAEMSSGDGAHSGGGASSGNGAQLGAQLFQEKGCSQCHFTDSRENRIGPGLEGLFDREDLPVSGRAVTEENVARQLVDPYENMPSFEDKLTDEEIDAIIAHLKTL